jgi:cold shock CspA family protein
MASVQSKGRLTSWKDDRGFGFIKPDNGGKEVFLHISALQQANRRPQVGDTILYEQVAEPKGKVRAAKASIQGVVSRPLGNRRSLKRGGLLKKLTSIGFLVITIPLALEFNPSRYPSLISSITKPGCTIKGNISHDTGNRLYHLPGMEDYKPTVIDPGRGEQWFCDESEAIAKGWRKAPR